MARFSAYLDEELQSRPLPRKDHTDLDMAVADGMNPLAVALVITLIVFCLGMANSLVTNWPGAR
jgi:hypothetical protein